MADRHLGFEDRRVRLLRRAIAVTLAAGLAAFLARGADGPANPSLGPAPPSTTAPTTPGG